MPDNTKILVAEDNDFVRMQVVRYLLDAGYFVHEAIDGAEALNAVKFEDIDLAIVDVRMQPVDGFEFIRALRGMDNQIPVVLITGDNSPDILEKCSEWRVNSVLIKPVQKERLVMAVARSLDIVKRKS
jgi:CheY-like chemotaxis protein